MKILKRTVFGNPILRQACRRLSAIEIRGEFVQQLIADMRYTVQQKKYGVGLAAPQIGYSLALSVISIKPTKARPTLEPFDTVIINPEVIETFGIRKGLWEGCLSFGLGSATPYAKALRYKKIKVRYYDEFAKLHEQNLEGIVAHVFQHETDHINGVLFVDHVRDSTTYMTIGEYIKRKPK